MPCSRDSKNRGDFRAGSRQRCGQTKLATESFPAFFTFFVDQAWKLPFALAFAVRAMMFVAIEELVPESQFHGNADIATLSTIFGFTVMMCLAVGLS